MQGLYHTGIFTPARRGARGIALFLVLALSLSPLTAFAQAPEAGEGDVAGRVIVTRGQVIAMESSGAQRSLDRRDEIYVGDTIFTMDNAYTQIRMVDGARISLTEFTEFEIVEYTYEENPDSDLSVINLIHGGFRTVTGAIGEANRDAYSAQVGSLAHIGIRGTDFEVVITPQGEIVTGVYDGGTTFSNDLGSLDLGVGANYDFGIIENPQSPPVGLIQQPGQLTQIAINATAALDDDEDEQEREDGSADGADEDAARQVADGDNDNSSDDDNSTADDDRSAAGDDNNSAVASNDSDGNRDDSSNADRDSGISANSFAAVGTTSGTETRTDPIGSTGDTRTEDGSNQLSLELPDNNLLAGNDTTGASSRTDLTEVSDDPENLILNPNDNRGDGSIEVRDGSTDVTVSDSDGNSVVSTASLALRSQDQDTTNDSTGGDTTVSGIVTDSGSDSSTGDTTGDTSRDDTGTIGSGSDDNSTTGSSTGSDDTSADTGGGSSDTGTGDHSGGDSTGTDSSSNDSGTSGSDDSGTTGTDDGSSGTTTGGDTSGGTSGTDDSSGTTGSDSSGDTSTGDGTAPPVDPTPTVLPALINWGSWNNPVPLDVVQFIESTDGSVKITTSDFFADVNPAPVANLTGNFQYASSSAAFVGHGNTGAISNVAVSMGVDFDSGAIFDGTLDVQVPDQTWSVQFGGAISGFAANLDLIGGQILGGGTIPISTSITGSMGGIFAGAEGETFVGGFELLDAVNSLNTVEGIYAVDR